MCYFTQCCGCIPLKTGCFILGYFNLVKVILITIFLGAMLGAGIIVSNDPKHQEEGVAVIAIGVILIILMLVSLAFTITLLVGLHKDKPGHVKAFLIYNLVLLALSVLAFIMSISTGFLNDMHVASRAIHLAFLIYFMLVIRNQYIDMTKGIKPLV